MKGRCELSHPEQGGATGPTGYRRGGRRARRVAVAATPVSGTAPSATAATILGQRPVLGAATTEPVAWRAGGARALESAGHRDAGAGGGQHRRTD